MNKFTNHSLDGPEAYNIKEMQALISFFHGFVYLDALGAIK